MSQQVPPSSALVTGASGGIGRAVVDVLLARRLAVTGLGMDDASFAALQHVLGNAAHAIDARDVAALTDVVRDAQPDVLVNNAGVLGELAALADQSPEAIDAMLDINLRAAIHATHAALPSMIARQRGHIFFTGSIAATRPTAHTAVYSATKAAIHAFADGLRLDLHGSGIRVTVLAPGRVETALYNDALGGHDAAFERMYRDLEALQPSDIADLIGFALDLPPHVDVTRLEVIPTNQAYGGATFASRTVAP